MYIAPETLVTFNYDSDLLKKVKTGGELWVYGIGFKSNHTVLLQLRRFKKNQNGSCWRYQKTYFGNALRIAKNALISVLYLRRGYFKGDKIVIEKYILKKLKSNNYFSIIPRKFAFNLLHVEAL